MDPLTATVTVITSVNSILQYVAKGVSKVKPLLTAKKQVTAEGIITTTNKIQENLDSLRENYRNISDSTELEIEEIRKSILGIVKSAPIGDNQSNAKAQDLSKTLDQMDVILKHTDDLKQKLDRLLMQTSMNNPISNPGDYETKLYLLKEPATFGIANAIFYINYINYKTQGTDPLVKKRILESMEIISKQSTIPNEQYECFLGELLDDGTRENRWKAILHYENACCTGYNQSIHNQTKHNETNKKLTRLLDQRLRDICCEMVTWDMHNGNKSLNFELTVNRQCKTREIFSSILIQKDCYNSILKFSLKAPFINIAPITNGSGEVRLIIKISHAEQYNPLLKFDSMEKKWIWERFQDGEVKSLCDSLLFVGPNEETIEIEIQFNSQMYTLSENKEIKAFSRLSDPLDKVHIVLEGGGSACTLRISDLLHY